MNIPGALSREAQRRGKRKATGITQIRLQGFLRVLITSARTPGGYSYAALVNPQTIGYDISTATTPKSSHPTFCWEPVDHVAFGELPQIANLMPKRSRARPTNTANSDHRTETQKPKDQDAGAPINNLPNELLLDIFRLVLDLDFSRILDTGYFADGLESYRSINKLRRVTSKWNSLVENAPELWVRIDPWVEEKIWRMAVKKSQDSLLEVCCPSRYRRIAARIPKPFIEELPSFAHRVGSLAILEMDLADLLVENVNMTGLTTLRINYPGFPEFRGSGMETKLARWAPNVRDVYIETSFTWPDPGWTALKSLSLHATEKPIDVLQVLEILSASPNLNRLHLSGEVTTTTGARSLPKVDLAELEYLSIKISSTTALFQILDSITALPSEEVDIHVCPGDLDDTDLAKLRILARFADGLGGRLSQSLRVKSDWESRGVYLAGSRFKVTAWPPADSRGVFLEGPEVDERMLEGLRHVLEGLGASRLENVENADINIPSLTPAIHTLCPSIRSLKVWPLSDSPVILSLLSSGDHGPQGEWLLPRLSHVKLSVEKPGMVREIRDMIAARVGAHQKGLIAEKIHRLEMTLRTRYMYRGGKKKDREQQAKVAGWIKEIERLIPNVQAEDYLDAISDTGSESLSDIVSDEYSKITELI
ncbi:hypothetical protein FRB90_012728 [Tulasnella sp. 427]|nr:hypothetical protein FRB90_012728 [Tulasnella sp. 427]